MTNLNIQLGKAGSIDVNVAKLKSMANVAEYIFNYGLKQMLNDVHASITDKTDPDEKIRNEKKVALAQKKLDSLMAGEVAQARVMSGLSPLERKMRELAEKDMTAKAKAAGKKVSDFDKAVWNAVVDKQVKAREAAYRTAAEAILAVKVEPAESDDFDILGALAEAAKSEEPEADKPAE